jgi:GcrA cell cycle regulator
MAPSFPNFRNNSNSDYPKFSLTLISEYQKSRLRLAAAVARQRREGKTPRGEVPMQINWTPEHCDALREYLAKGMSYSQSADAINAKFKTAYSRNAALGRARRMGMAGPERTDESRHRSKQLSKAAPPHRRRERKPSEFVWPMPVFERTETAKLRCVEIEPRRLSLIDLERGDCRYPYGGDEDGEAITFCGHPRRPGSSYCAPHFHLTRGPDVELERAVSAVVLRLVKAA